VQVAAHVADGLGRQAGGDAAGDPGVDVRARDVADATLAERPEERLRRAFSKSARDRSARPRPPPRPRVRMRCTCASAIWSTVSTPAAARYGSGFAVSAMALRSCLVDRMPC
jgi:hypothetical protein